MHVFMYAAAAAGANTVHMVHGVSAEDLPASLVDLAPLASLGKQIPESFGGALLIVAHVEGPFVAVEAQTLSH